MSQESADSTLLKTMPQAAGKNHVAYNKPKRYPSVRVKTVSIYFIWHLLGQSDLVKNHGPLQAMAKFE